MLNQIQTSYNQIKSESWESHHGKQTKLRKAFHTSEVCN